MSVPGVGNLPTVETLRMAALASLAKAEARSAAFGASTVFVGAALTDDDRRVALEWWYGKITALTRRATLLVGRMVGVSGSSARAFATSMSAAASMEASDPLLGPWSDIVVRRSRDSLVGW